ncbi:uncharacterized protein SPPG_06833 [Spizellomyces punctatus DAOM BR117]|uniref:Guanylate cyclase domain-containing protein n=1 Tax=Spizellomyces punctatus (strain DAOM BR117) TaxID=645134 RepID=A0A0L0HA00_SPIPD|nr:uncharacterized protein SPPG_06833 [Spizellomyces punctatus DAOM BR117]KNC97836.1 hypothetical protein SPPG_06833 [Spizellomyces punctatus DAOM BR117]|eukprot:XP_016605876.1 hypothetical protein SPPG_06833 [Spizellomyces punctatus DAOM BR117]
MSTATDMIVPTAGGALAAQSSGHAGTGAVTHTHQTDHELERILTLMKVEDQALALALEKERASMESTMERIHRLNNFRIDEAHIRESNIAESRFLVDAQDAERKALTVREAEEAASLKEEEEDKRMLEMLLRELRTLKLGVRQKAEASEKVMAVKKRLAERRTANQLRLVGVEVRQERERKALQDSHVRIIKNMNMFRTLLLQDIEDAALDNLIANGSMSDDGTVSQKGTDRADADKLHQTKMLQLKLRMQKEVEQLREEHLMKLKHMMKVCELELEQTEEIETLMAEQKIQEMEVETEQRKEIENEEDQIAQQRASLKAFHTQRALQAKASRTLAHQRYEARQLARQQKIAAKQRERQFFASEEALRESMRAMSQEEQEEDEASSQVSGHIKSSKPGSARHSVAGLSEISSTDQSEISDITTDSHADTAIGDDAEASESAQAVESVELEEQIRKERSRIEELTKRHYAAMEALRIQQRELREITKREHATQMNRLLGEQEDEYKQLKIQHHHETEALLSTQSAANALEEDNKGANELLYGMLPRYVADAMKMGHEIPPKDFETVTILYSDIVQFTNLTAKSSPNQIVNLLNRLYTAFDSALDDYADLYKTETIGDAYQIVAGLNQESEQGGREAVIRRNAMDTIDCALRFLTEIRNLDMTDQVMRDLHIRIGIHSGPCVGGVAGVTMPKFAIFGDTVNIANQMEQKSKPNRIHISQATYDLVKDAPFVFEKVEGAVVLEGGVTCQTYWVTGRKDSAAKVATAGGKKKARVVLQ